MKNILITMKIAKLKSVKKILPDVDDNDVGESDEGSV